MEVHNDKHIFYQIDQTGDQRDSFAYECQRILRKNADRELDLGQLLATAIRPYFNGNFPVSDDERDARRRLSAVDEDRFEEQAKLVGDYLQSLPAYDADEMLGLSDEELVKRFPQMYALYSAAQGAVELLGSGQADIRGYLSDESREQLKKLAADTLVFSAAMARYEMICNPRYESVKRIIRILSEMRLNIPWVAILRPVRRA